ncbi:hypothetical protein AB0368_03140 [Actinoplanes sp. NPDC051475]|uniref:hypothetical protein n=1 Tax=Actinoplanes sp. NPDC051475 TaxID=3157225 RepID=UPI0034504745
MTFTILAAALAGLGNQIGHPNQLQRDRLLIAVWLLVVYGLPLAAGRNTTRETAAEVSAVPRR